MGQRWAGVWQPQADSTRLTQAGDINVPQLYANVDRTRAKQMGINLADIYDTMQVNLGSLYVNDFTRFGKTHQVVVQADAPFRRRCCHHQFADAQRRW
jgi:multidrug efflux pump